MEMSMKIYSAGQVVIAHEKRGIILFHDIHDRAGKVLPVLIPKLRAEGYTLAGLNSEGRLRVQP
jgi:peptidoglycan/xylan/chitin deacetylase (PgdA/CDA1 family)